jgi:hypothetical protein
MQNDSMTATPFKVLVRPKLKLIIVEMHLPACGNSLPAHVRAVCTGCPPRIYIPGKNFQL